MNAPSFTVDYSLQQFFFDRAKIQAEVDRNERRELSKIGAFVRRRARSSLRRRKRVSLPGEKPSIRSRDSASLKTILFGYVPQSHSVVIGPVKLNGSNLGNSTVPNLLEFGGRTTVHESRYYDRRMPWHQGIWKQGPVEHRKRNVRIRSRPFMGPAFEEELAAGTIADVWAGFLSR